MTQEEEKQLLSVDLSGRLQYGVKMYYNTSFEDGDGVLTGTFLDYDYIEIDDSKLFLSDCKPYLRPMSSMTDKEKKELIKLFGTCQAIEPGVGSTPWYNVPETKIELIEFSFRYTHKLVDWLNKHMFDYRGLIPLGLSLEAPEGMYNY